MATDNNIDPLYVPTLHAPELAEHVSSINTYVEEAAEYLKQYTSAIQSIFKSLHNGDDDHLMRVFPTFDIKQLFDQDRDFVEKSLKFANYHADALKGETVILFSQPVIVSKVCCFTRDPSNQLGLICFSEVTKVHTSGSVKVNNESPFPEAEYKIHDVVLGFVLPRASNFKYVDVATTAWMLQQNPNALKTANDALNKAITVPNILNDKFNNIKSILNSKIDAKKSLTEEVNVLRQMQEHEKKVLENIKNNLAHVKTNLTESQQEYKDLSESIAGDTTKLNDLEQEISGKTESLNIATKTLDDLRSKTKKESEALKVVEQELADANRQKNLTTLDMVGHANETSKQLKPYYMLAFLIFVALACITTYIYQKGENFIDTLPSLIDVSSWDILLSRLPLMTATALIIGGLSSVLFFLVKHIIFLNTEKMTMLKAAILAEQITNSIGCDSMSEQEMLEFKRDTKIKLITQTFSKGEPEIDKARFVMDVLKAISDKK